MKAFRWLHLNMDFKAGRRGKGTGITRPASQHPSSTSRNRKLVSSGPPEQREALGEEAAALTFGCPSRRSLWKTWQNFQQRTALLERGSRLTTAQKVWAPFSWCVPRMHGERCRLRKEFQGREHGDYRAVLLGNKQAQSPASTRMEHTQS